MLPADEVPRPARINARRVLPVALDVRDPEKFLRNIAYTCEHLMPKPKVVVVNQEFARRYLAGRSPLGQMLKVKGDPMLATKVQKLLAL